MFGWSIARSAGAMFSRLAIRRVCKFLLKQKLGKFILGDLDLDQLDVQLAQGSIHLTDLALNVDYINQKLCAVPVIVKEGSIASLFIKIPWKLANCEIEVDGIELVLTSCMERNVPREDNVPAGQDDKQSINGIDNYEGVVAGGTANLVSVDVHEGVKTIAMMVKWLLTSFHVKVKKVIVAFEPFLKNDQLRSKFDRILVLRILEAEYGTCISEDGSKPSVSAEDTLLGMSRLTNSVSFQGGVLELLQMDDVDIQNLSPEASETIVGDIHVGSMPAGSTTPILTGGVTGFSGTLRLSIPWKNGSLDISKVDADVFIDPMELRLEPSTLSWILCFWECTSSVDVDGWREMHHKTTDASFLKSPVHSHTFFTRSAKTATVVMGTGETLSYDLSSQNNPALEKNSLMQGAYVIPDWVPFSINGCPTDGVEPDIEPDIVSSIDQFFECFDGMRSCHAAALSNSGMWNWTCSVFSAITAASSLASGSLQITPEHQHVETTLRATVAGISIIFSFHDRNQGRPGYHGVGDGSASNAVIPSIGTTVPIMDGECLAEANSVCESVHYLEANCQELVLSFQIHHQSLKFEAKIRHFEVDDCFNGSGGHFGILDSEKSVYNQMNFVQHLQDAVHGSLPSFPFSTYGSDLVGMRSVFNTPDCPQRDSVDSNLLEVVHRDAIKGVLLKVKVLKSLATLECQFGIKYIYNNDKSDSSTNFSIDLPPFLLWVNFYLVNILLDLSRRIGNSFDRNISKNDSVLEDFGEGHGSFNHEDLGSGSYTYVRNVTPSRSVQGNIYLPHSRIIFCFPFQSHCDFRNYASWDEFICIDIFPSLSLKKVGEVLPFPSISFQNEYSHTPSNLIQVNFRDLNIYLVSSACENGGDNNSYIKTLKFSVEKILSATCESDSSQSPICVSWQNGCATGPWIVSKAFGLASSQESKNRSQVTGKDYEFASVSAVEHPVETDSCIRQEIILSSAFVLHAHFSLVWVNLECSEFELVKGLLNQLVCGFTEVQCTKVAMDGFKKECNSARSVKSSQVSVLMECDVVNLSIKTEKGFDFKCSIQKELPGSWDCLKLMIEKFGVLSVSNIGAITGANFVWVNHTEGELWGCISGINHDSPIEVQELLISCRNTTMRRGDGEGSNALSSGYAGTVFMHFLDPQSFQSYTSITVRGGTVVAPGGRMDWVNEIVNFFASPANSNDQASDSSMQHGSPADHVHFVASFFLNLVDIAFSYEPYVEKSMFRRRGSEYRCNSTAKSAEDCDESIACLLAASSLTLSNRPVTSCAASDYRIRALDLGLLVCNSSSFESYKGIYSVDYLHKNGYVKIASEALVEAVLRTNCNNGLLWELECSGCCVNLSTCSDTMAGLFHLVAQLQQLFAPDLEESIQHLQNRWNNTHQAHGGHDNAKEVETCESTTFTTTSGQSSCSYVENESPAVGLLDEICEDAFYTASNQNCSSSSGIVQSHTALDGGLSADANDLIDNVLTSDNSENVSFRSPALGLGFDNAEKPSPPNDCFPKLIESYYMSEMLSRSQPSENEYSHGEVDMKCKPINAVHVDMECGSSRWYEDGSLRIIEDHVSKVGEDHMERHIPEGKLSSVASEEPSKPCGCVLLRNIDVRWMMYAGFDWHNSRKSAPSCMNTVGRDANACLEIMLSQINIRYDTYPVGELHVSSLFISVRDFHLYDCSKDAPWKKVLGYYKSKDHPRESHAKAFTIDLEAVRPDPLIPLEEYMLRCACLPLRLHLDQSQLDFLIGFFGGKQSSTDESHDVANDLDESISPPEKRHTSSCQTIAEEALLPFFQKFDIWPVILRVDYNPRHIDLTALQGGNYVELLNLIPWKGIELKLKHVHAVGIYGWGNVCETIIGEWLEDISHNQVHNLLKGLPPIRSLVAVGSGAAKLVSLPVKTYRKDRKLLKGVQRGAIAFLRSISLEAIGLGVHLAAGAHDILLQTEYILTSTPSSVPVTVRSISMRDVQSNQPKDVQQGIQQAYESISDGLGKAACALVANPIKAYQRGAGVGSALATAVRAAPAAAVAPASAAAHAMHCTLLGFRNSLDPEHKKESMEKYLGQAPDQRK